MKNNLKKWTNILGEPQGNEYVDQSDIVREIDTHQFKVLWSFGCEETAKKCFSDWTKENSDKHHETFEDEFFNFHLFATKSDLENRKFEIMFAPTKNFIHPPISKNSLKKLADFIYDYINRN